MPDAPRPATGHGDEPPPLLGRWRNIYLLLAGELALLILLFRLLRGWAS